MHTIVTADTLNGAIDFDCPFTVHPADSSGRVVVTHADGVHAPEGLIDVVTVDDFDDDRWELVTGYSGQHRYSGPIMHDSETLSGGMARDVLATPGTYVVMASQYLCTDEEHANGEPVTDDDPRETWTDEHGVAHTYVTHDACESHWEGWALLRLVPND